MQTGGVAEDTRLGRLPRHLAQLIFPHGEAIPLQHRSVEGRAALLTYRRQLGRIAQQNQAAMFARIDILHQVVEQPAGTIHRTLARRVGNHRGLIDDKEGVFGQILAHEEPLHVGRIALLPVDAAVYRIGGMAGVAGKDLGRPSRRGKQHHLALQLGEGLDQRPHQRSLARAGIASQQKERVVVLVEHKSGQHLQQFALLPVGGVGQITLYLLNKQVGNHGRMR